MGHVDMMDAKSVALCQEAAAAWPVWWSLKAADASPAADEEDAMEWFQDYIDMYAWMAA